MNVYSYDPVTGALVGSAAAQPDPLELAVLRATDPEAEPTAWLVPAYATLIAPPTIPAGQQAVFANGAWTLQAAPPPADPETAAPTTAQLWTQHQLAAAAALEESDHTILRCFEHNVGVPAEWSTYRAALRAIISATTGDPTQALPTKPAYPAGT